MNRFVLYYQSQGVQPHLQDPYVLCVGTRERCESVRRALLADPFFRLVQIRDRQAGVMRIVPQSEGRSVVYREIPFHRSVPALGAVEPL
jgi:hypothetical protein